MTRARVRTVRTDIVCASELQVRDHIVIPNGSSFPVLALEIDEEADEVRIHTGALNRLGRGPDLATGFFECPPNTRFKVRRET